MQATVLFFIIALIITSFGALSPVNEGEIKQYRKFEEEELPHVINVQYIFGNNFMICLGMFVPFFGPFWGAYVLFSTGKALAVMGAINNVHPVVLLATTFLFPFAWMEYIAYSFALTQSLWLAMAIFQRKFKTETKHACLMVTLTAIILFVAAVIEVALIQISSGLI